MSARLCLAAALLAALGGGPSLLRAEVLEWSLRNDYPYIVYLRFFSRTRPERAWPGGSESYILDDDLERTVRLQCETGETICFGAFTKSRRIYWGVGEFGDKRCTDCCRVCGENRGKTDVLN